MDTISGKKMRSELDAGWVPWPPSPPARDLLADLYPGGRCHGRRPSALRVATAPQPVAEMSAPELEQGA